MAGVDRLTFSIFPSLRPSSSKPKTAIAAATGPLAPAVAQQATDGTAFNTALDALSTAALAAKVPGTVLVP